MSLPRASMRWASRLSGPTSRSARMTGYRRSYQQHQNRRYASGSDEGAHGSTHKASGDLPWAIASIIVTVPSTWYLLQPQLNKSAKGHGHGHHEDEKGNAHDEEEDENDKESAGESSESEGDDTEKTGDRDNNEGNGTDEAEGAKSDDSDSEGGGRDTPETSDDEGPENTAHEKEGGDNVEGVQFKGSTSGGTKEGEQGDTRKHIPDAKGFNKKRIESDYGNRQGEAQNEEQHHSNKDMAAAAKDAPTDKTTQSGKQEGLTNSDTKHSTDITNSPEKSTKGEGTPETSKSKGTVDPRRPQV